MKTIKNAAFLKSEQDFSNYKGFDKPEIMMVGRSNVGKSSLINLIAGRKALAKVSSTQGKTRLVNFFELNSEFILVDVPGYGFAQTSHTEQNKWNKIINDYLKKTKNLVCTMLLVDIRHEPTDQDVQMLGYLTYNNIPVTIVATKYDKIKKSETIKKLTAIASKLKVGIENIYVVSSETGHGKQELIDRIYQFVGV